MYLEQGALRVSPLLSSRAIMTVLTRKYKEAAEMLCGIDGNQHSELSTDEILMLIRTPSYRLLLEKSYSKLIGKPVPDDSFFERLYNIGIDRESLIRMSSNTTNDLIVPAPFLTSLLYPPPNSNKRYQDSSSLVCEIYKTFNIFSGISSKWSITKPTTSDIEMIKAALQDLGKIALEPIEDIAFNVRFIAVAESSIQQSDVSFGASFSFLFLPGIIFLGGFFLKKHEELIESLYHESLHVKWVNTYHAYDMLRFELLLDIERFICPWATNDEDRQWTFTRAAAAYHVYCHLLAFHRLIVKQRGPYNEWSSKRIPTIREKLQILGEYINRTRSKCMTDLGIQYFDLLSTIGEM